MQYFKNALLVATFALLSLTLQANTPVVHTITNTELTTTAPQGDGIVEIVQGLHRLKIDILVTGIVTLEIRNSDQEVVFSRDVRPQRRFVRIPTDLYPEGDYSLTAIANVGTEVVFFSVGDKEE